MDDDNMGGTTSGSAIQLWQMLVLLASDPKQRPKILQLHQLTHVMSIYPYGI